MIDDSNIMTGRTEVKLATFTTDLLIQLQALLLKASNA
jgi:hypothetical protein